MFVQVQDRQDRIRVALFPVAFYGSPHSRLRQNKVRQVVCLQKLGIALEQLVRKPFYGKVIDLRIWVEKVEVDIDETLLACKKMSGC